MLFIKSSSHPQQKRPAKKQVCIVYFNALKGQFCNRDSIPIVTMLPYKFKDRKRLNEQKKRRNFYGFLCIIHESKSGVRPPEPFGSGLWIWFWKNQLYCFSRIASAVSVSSSSGGISMPRSKLNTVLPFRRREIFEALPSSYPKVEGSS